MLEFCIVLYYYLYAKNILKLLSYEELGNDVFLCVFVLQKWSFTQERYFWDDIDIYDCLLWKFSWILEFINFFVYLLQMYFSLYICNINKANDSKFRTQNCLIVWDNSSFIRIDIVSSFFHSVLRQYHRATIFLIYLIMLDYNLNMYNQHTTCSDRLTNAW